MEVRRSEFVGPAVGAELRETAGLAMLVALGAVMLYIMFRFTGKFSIGAVTAANASVKSLCMARGFLNRMAIQIRYAIASQYTVPAIYGSGGARRSM